MTALHSWVDGWGNPQCSPRGRDGAPFPAKGMTGGEIEVLGYRGMKEYEIGFDGFKAPAANLLGGAEGQGFKLAMGALNVVRLAQVGARAVGKASHVLEQMSAYAQDRQQFGTRIADFQMVQQMLADSVIDIHAARLMVWQAAWMIDAGIDARDHIAMVKVHAAETLGRVADRAVQIFGGAGYLAEYGIERFYRDVRLFRIYEGTSQIHQLNIATISLQGRTHRFQNCFYLFDHESTPWDNPPV